MPLLGVIVQLKRGHTLPVLGLWQFHSPWPADRATARSILRIHNFLADALLILAGIHAVAALTHHYVWRDRTLTRMLPRKAAAGGAHPLSVLSAAAAPARSMLRSLDTARNFTPRLASAAARSAEWQ